MPSNRRDDDAGEKAPAILTPPDAWGARSMTLSPRRIRNQSPPLHVARYVLVLLERLGTRRVYRCVGSADAVAALRLQLLEHDPEKACPGLDHKRVHARLPTHYGWIPVFGKISSTNKLSGMTIRRKVIPLQAVYAQIAASGAGRSLSRSRRSDYFGRPSRRSNSRLSSTSCSSCFANAAASA